MLLAHAKLHVAGMQVLETPFSAHLPIIDAGGCDLKLKSIFGTVMWEDASEGKERRFRGVA